MDELDLKARIHALQNSIEAAKLQGGNIIQRAEQYYKFLIGETDDPSEKRSQD